jgi:outer membrane receptor for ferrienterochelin and colicins
MGQDYIKFIFNLFVWCNVLLCTNLLAQEKGLEELLNLELTELMKIQVISASKTPENVTETPATVRIISDRKIRENGYFTLDEALAELPGFQFRDMLSLNSYVFQRGVPNQNNLILVLIDGIYINELNSGGFYGGGQYNLSNVQRIEVVYGPASALYGTNAISGIINIITKDAQDSEGLNISALYGTFNTRYADAAYGYFKNEFGLRLSAMYKSSDKADLGGSAGDNNWTDQIDNFENDYSFDAKIQYRKFTAGVIFQNKQISAATYRRSTGTIYWDRETLWNIRFINSYIKHRHNFSDNYSLFSQVYFRDATVLDNSVQVVVDTAQIGFYRPNYLLGFESTLNAKINDKLKLTLGLVLEKENLASDYTNTQSSSPLEKPPKPAKPDMEGNNLVSFYLQTDYAIFSEFHFTAGVRYDNSSVYDQNLTPRCGLIYNSGRLTAKLLYMQAFRAPKPWDYTWGMGNRNLDPERMKSVEAYLGYRVMDDFQVEASVYKNFIYDVLIKDINKNHWTNEGKLNTDGFELSLTRYSHRFEPYFNYTFNNSYYGNGLEVPEISKHNFNLGFRYAIVENCILNLRANYLGKRKNYNEIIQATGNKFIDPVLVIHSTITIPDFRGFEFQLIVKNLLNTVYYHPSNRTNADYLISRFRQPQRTIMIKTDYHF